MWKPCNGSNTPRQRRIRKLRKSERLRLIEMELLRTQFQVEILQAAVASILEANNLKTPDLDAGKWYNAKLNGNK